MGNVVRIILTVRVVDAKIMIYDIVKEKYSATAHIKINYDTSSDDKTMPQPLVWASGQ